MGPRKKQTLRWRDALNPLRQLTLARVVALREAYDRGEMADIQWAFRAVERSDADLLALIERRTGAILEMDWNVKKAEGKKQQTGSEHSPASRAPSSPDEVLAEEQAAALREAYESLDNLYEGIEHLSLAIFRGYAHLQKQPHHLEPVEPWNVVRNGSAPQWKYNPEARPVPFASLPDSLLMDPAEFVILEHPRPIDHYALPKHVRTALAERDWTTFVDIYGVPSGVVILPPQVPAGREDEYAQRAQSISEGAAGSLPNGADYKPNDGPRGINPFRGFLDYFTEKLVLVGTGGLLTMLAQSGSGTLAGGAHADTFRTLARGHGRRISEALQRQFDQPFLQAQFPGKPVLAYFTLEFQAEPDVEKAVEHILKLSQAGYTVTREEISERTGYEVTAKPPPVPLPGAPLPKREGRGEGDQPVPPTPDSEPTAELQAIRNRLSELRRTLSR
jgi:phage gp29-like protein